VARERDPFANFDRMRRQIDELFGDFFERSGIAPRRGFSPNVDVFYVGDPPRAVVQADLGGVDIDCVTLEIRGRQLVIAGERRPPEGEPRAYQQVEIPHGPFRRVVELGADVAGEEARATYEDGMLRVEIPLAAADPREVRIEVRGESAPEE
jgi:HSP20 family protein